MGILMIDQGLGPGDERQEAEDLWLYLKGKVEILKVRYARTKVKEHTCAIE
jgi:hypothetical protein